jgi:DNA (cytosine-5)-methyltransferase 1
MARLESLPGGPNGRRVAELFAGVGGFRLGLEQAGWQVVWSNQWEPSTKKQHASDVYVERFGSSGHSNEDISRVLDRCDRDWTSFPDHELLVGGFPCQDYSVARTLNQAAGLRGKKGVLWWEIHRILANKTPPLALLENVDRLLKSPASQRGRDFAIMLASLADLGYWVEWRVVNAADYGYPQRRRRVYITAYGERSGISVGRDPLKWISSEGLMARALPVREPDQHVMPFPIQLQGDLDEISRRFGHGAAQSPFQSGGVLVGREAWTMDLQPLYAGPRRNLADIILAEDSVDDSYFIPRSQLAQWKYLKGAKREPRVHRRTQVPYIYSEGAVPFPDPLEAPSRTILTGEGGSSPSRFKHVVRVGSRRLRRLTPIELERLNGFTDDWTSLNTISDARRAFLMGNALVVGIVAQIGTRLAESRVRRPLEAPTEVRRRASVRD